LIRHCQQRLHIFLWRLLMLLLLRLLLRWLRLLELQPIGPIGLKRDEVVHFRQLLIALHADADVAVGVTVAQLRDEVDCLRTHVTDVSRPRLPNLQDVGGVGTDISSERQGSAIVAEEYLFLLRRALPAIGPTRLPISASRAFQHVRSAYNLPKESLSYFLLQEEERMVEVADMLQALHLFIHSLRCNKRAGL
jgi:hypothetical protein